MDIDGIKEAIKSARFAINKIGLLYEEPMVEDDRETELSSYVASLIKQMNIIEEKTGLRDDLAH